MAKQRTLVERDINKAKAGVDKHNPAAVRVREEVARLKRKLKAEEKNAANKRAELEEQQGKLAQLHEELQRVQDAAKAHAKEAAAQAAKAGQLSPAALDEYNELKAKAGAQSSRLLTDCSAAESALQADRQALTNVEEALAAMDARLEALGMRLGDVMQATPRLQARRWQTWPPTRQLCRPAPSRTGSMPSRRLLRKPTSRGSSAAAGACRRASVSCNTNVDWQGTAGAVGTGAGGPAPAAERFAGAAAREPTRQGD